ncbi:MAG: AraC family transcriptional regulator, partial [Lentisphaeria bacterium]|nr:AraC family transcriptional regulator [Lentisphaeria bacterium]
PSPRRAWLPEHGLPSIWNVLFDPSGLELPASLSDTLSTYRRFFDPRYQPQAGCGLADRRTRLDSAGLNRAQTLIRRIIREQQQRSPGWRLAATAAFTELVLLVCRAAPADFPEEPPRHGWLTTITDFLETNFARQVSLGDLAEMVHMSPSSLSHSFKKRLGCSPIEYVLSLRVQRAAEMLRDTPRSIAEIGDLVGFTDSNYFSRQFKNRLGLSPSSYRQRYRALEASRSCPTAKPPALHLPPECCG